MREIEVKVSLPNANEARRRLGLAGALALFPQCFEDNRVYDNRERDFSREWRLLRLRSTRGKHTLCFKHPPERTQAGILYKVRIEHETDVDDLESMELILQAIGYEQVWHYQKYRQRYELDGVILELDELPFGVFLEFEGEPEAIDRVAGNLGFQTRDYIKATYRELFCQYKGEEEPGDLLFEGSSPASP